MNIDLLKIIIIGSSLIVGTSAYLVSKKPNTPIEQFAEAVLSTQGIDIDFSPG